MEKIYKLKSDLEYEYIQKHPGATDGLYANPGDCHIIGYQESSSGRQDEAYLYVGLDKLVSEYAADKISKKKIADKKVNGATLHFAMDQTFLPFHARSNGYFSVYGVPHGTTLDYNSLSGLNGDVLANAIPVRDDENKYYLEFDISPAISKDYMGIVIRGNHTNDGMSAESRAFIITDDNATRLALSYTDKSYLHGNKTLSQSCNAAGNGAVDLFTGALTFVHDILNVEGTQFPMNVALVYNSNNASVEEINGYVFGAGWRPNFMQELRLVASRAEGNYKVYEYIDGNGYKREITTRYYKNYTSAGKTYKLYGSYSEGCELLSEISDDEFVLTENGSELVLTDKANNKLRFTDGVLTSVEKPETADDPTLKMTVSYESKRIALSDAKGRTVEFKFISSVNRLERIVYNDTVYYVEPLSGTKFFENIRGPHDRTTKFEHKNGYLSKITDPSGYTLEYGSTVVDGKPKITGYAVKSSVHEIFYAADEYDGKTAGAEKTLDSVTITYDAKMTGVISSNCSVQNLTEVKNLSGATTYYCFDSSGMATAVIDGKGNMQAGSVGVKTRKVMIPADTDKMNTVFGYEINQKSANVLYSSSPIQGVPFGVKTYIFGNQFVDEDDSLAYGVMNTSKLYKGWYLFSVKIAGCVAAGGHFNDLAEAKQKRIPYVALRVIKKYKNGNNITTQEEFVKADPTVSGFNKEQFLFLPFYVEETNIQNVSADIVTDGNPNDIFIEQWQVVRCGEGSSVTVKDKDTVTTETFKNGALTVTTSDITKTSANSRVANVVRGDSSRRYRISTFYSTSKFPERVKSRIVEDYLYSGYNHVTDEYTYDSYGNVTCEEKTDEYSSKIMRKEYSYDSLNSKLVGSAMTSATDEDGNAFGYDYFADTGYLKRAVLPGARNVDYTYGGDLLKSIELDDVKNEFSYTFGYLTKLVHNGCEYGFTYDGFGRLTEITVGGQKYIKAEYTDNGADIDGVTGATGKTVVSYYDSVSANSRHVYASYYNKYGELIKVRYAKTYAQNISFTSANDYITVEEWIEGPRFVKYTVDNTEYEYSYSPYTGEFFDCTERENGVENIKTEVAELDGCGRVKTVKYTVAGMGEQTYKYDYKSNFEDTVTRVTLSNGAKEESRADRFGRFEHRGMRMGEKDLDESFYYKASKTQHGTANKYTTPLVERMNISVSDDEHDYKYTYDENGNITQITDFDITVATYEYDKYNRLVRENNVQLNKVTECVYDEAGNITSKTVNGRVYNYRYAQTGNKDRLIGFDGNDEISYDDCGNPKQWFKHGISSAIKYDLEWEHVNRPKSITDTDTNTKYEYTYNMNGIRTGKKVGNTVHKYYLDGEKIIAETRTTGNKVDKLKYYYGATGICGFNYNGEDYYFGKNLQGDIIDIFDEEGERYGEYAYDAWGNCTILHDDCGVATANPFRYRGYYLDNETGLWYLNSRYYDSVVGRFLSPDELDYLDPETLGGLNLYSYCNNNPVMYSDPSGHSACDNFLLGLLVILIGAFIGGIYGGVSAWMHGENFWTGVGNGVAVGAMMGLSLYSIGFGATVAAKTVLGKPLVGAGVGSLVGLWSNLNSQLEKGGGYGSLDVSQLGKSWGAGGLVGGFAGLLSNTLANMGNFYGNALGMSLANKWLFGKAISTVVSPQLLMIAFDKIGGFIGGYIGGSIVNYYATESNINGVPMWLVSLLMFFGKLFGF